MTAADRPTRAPSQGAEKYGATGLLLSSADRGWQALQAELRSHGDGGVAWDRTHPDSEICVDLHGSGSVVSPKVAARGGAPSGFRPPARRKDDFTPLWAGQAVALTRALPARELMLKLVAEAVPHGCPRALPFERPRAT